MSTFDWNNPNVSKLLDLYIALFNRVPDAEGLTFWSQLLDRGFVSMQFVSQQFLAVAYSEKTYYTSSMSDGEFITGLYEVVLGRTGTLAPKGPEIAF